MTKIPSKIENIKTIEEFNVFIGKLNPHVTAMGGRKFTLQENGKTYTYSLNKLLSTANKLDPTKKNMDVRTTLMRLSKDGDSLLANKDSYLKNSAHKVRNSLGKLINRSSKKERVSLERSELLHTSKVYEVKNLISEKGIKGSDKDITQFIDNFLLLKESELNNNTISLLMTLQAANTLKKQLLTGNEIPHDYAVKMGKLKSKLDIISPDNSLEQELNKLLKLLMDDIALLANRDID